MNILNRIFDIELKLGSFLTILNKIRVKNEHQFFIKKNVCFSFKNIFNIRNFYVDRVVNEDFFFNSTALIVNRIITNKFYFIFK